MTEKQEFLDKLRAALVDRDISDSDIEPYMERFDRFYDRMINDPAAGNGSLLGDIDRIADNIAEQVSERYDQINRLAERTLTVDRVKDQDEPPAETEPPAPEDVGSDVAEPPDEPQPPDEQQTSDGHQPAGLTRSEPSEPELQPDGYPPLGEPPESPSRPPEYIDEEPTPSSTIFWVLFAVSLPLTLPLGLAALALFVIVWAALAAMIIGSIAFVIAGAAVGTALALVGIIYGISQLFSSVPVGLYELGLGVLAGSAAMFICILLYNFAVRLLPILIRLVGRLFCYLWGRLRVLFAFLRRECAKL